MSDDRSGSDIPQNPLVGGNPTQDQTPAGPSPDASGLPATSRPPVQAPAALSPVDQKHNLIGRAVSHIAHTLEGHQVNYVPDPATGDVKEVVTKRKPGGIFRDLMLGTFVGMAAGANAPRGSGSMGGFAAGASAGLQVPAAQQARRKAEASDEGQNIQKREQTNFQQAQIVNNTIHSLQHAHHVDFHNDEEMSRFNNSVELVKQTAMNNGGALAQITGPDGKELNNATGNGSALMRMVTADPSLMQGPDGYHRLPFFRYNTIGLERKGDQWIDPKTGDKPDWDSRATVTLVDVPLDMWSKNISLPGNSINTVAGRQLADVSKGRGTNNFTTTFGSLFALGTKNISDINKARQERMRGPVDEKEAMKWKGDYADTADNQDASPEDKELAASRLKKADAFLGNVATQAGNVKAAQEGAEGNKPPQSIEAATSALTAAQIDAQNNPSPYNQKKVADAQKFVDGLRQAKIQELKDSYPEQINLAAGKSAKEREQKEQYDRNLYGVLASGDPLGWKPKPNQFMTESQFNSAKDKFASGTLSKAEDVEKSYGMMQRAYGEYQAAKAQGKGLPTGAQSMVALSTHLSTTFGNVKGSRVTKDMIQEHLGARGITDGALVAVQKLTNGDVLSPEQWRAFNDLISQSRELTWDNATNTAHYVGLPADFLPGDYVAKKSGPQNGQNNLPALQPGFVRFQDSRGGVHDIPQANLKAARQRDPNLRVLTQ